MDSKLSDARVRTTTLVMRMLEALEEGFEGERESEAAKKKWARMFGHSQSMVVNLQKLVSSMKALHEMETALEITGYAETIMLNDAEQAMLRSWAATQKVIPAFLLEGTGEEGE